jgi:hypothetical protein
VRVTNLPDWLIYTAALGILLFAADTRRQKADAPAPPPPVPGEDTTPLSPLSPFNGAKILKISADTGRLATAFSIGEAGMWMTSAAAVRDCTRLAIVVAPGRGAEAKLKPITGSQLAVLTTDGGSPAMIVAEHRAKPYEDVFLPGFPQDTAGEAAVKYLGEAAEEDHHRGRPRLPEEAWAQIGRTDGLKGVLTGLEGAPLVDGLGHVQGVLLAEAPRRGRFYSAPLASVRQAIAAAKPAPGTQQDSDPITLDNYGRAADSFRRDLRVTQVWCGET